MLWCRWLGGRKGIRPVKTEWWGTGMVICMERDADLHTAQLMPLPLTVSCMGNRVVPDKRPLNGCVCVSVVKFLVVLLLIVMLVFVSSVSLFYCSVHQMYAAGCIVLWACVHAGWMTGLSPSSSFFLLLHTHMQTLAWKPNSCLV